MTATERRPGYRGLDTDDLVVLVALLALGLVVRLLYLAWLDVPAYDPWRHLTLVRNLRQGAGFTLFDGQPYLWYSPLWYYLCAALPSWFRMEWAAGLLSAAAVPLTYLLVRREVASPSRFAPVVGGVLMAASGPLVRFTCHYGPEAAALCLTLAALLLCAETRRAGWTLLAGLIFGTALVLRLNFAFCVFLFVPWARAPRRTTALLCGAALPLLLTWWRNHSIIRAHPWLFTWDGLATRSEDFDLLSTLVVQLHPAVQEGLRRLHEQTVPLPEWIASQGRPAWGLLTFMLCGFLGLLLARRASLVLCAASAVGYFLLFDHSMSSHFFRIYLVVFPAFFLALAVSVNRLRESLPRWGGRIAAALAVLMLLAGARQLEPGPMVPLEAVTPPENLLRADSYAVNSGFYHPESLIYRFPDKRFIGLPLLPEQYDEFRRARGEDPEVLWQPFSVQDELKAAIERDPRYRRAEAARNGHGRLYLVYSATPAPGRTQPDTPAQ